MILARSLAAGGTVVPSTRGGTGVFSFVTKFFIIDGSFAIEMIFPGAKPQWHEPKDKRLNSVDGVEAGVLSAASCVKIEATLLLNSARGEQQMIFKSLTDLGFTVIGATRWIDDDSVGVELAFEHPTDGSIFGLTLSVSGDAYTEFSPSLTWFDGRSTVVLDQLPERSSPFN